MKRIPCLSILAAALVLVSCASLSQPAVDRWLGATKDQLVEQMGKPNSSVSDGHDGEILVFVVSTYTEGFGCLAPEQYYVVSRFFVDAAGKIYKHEEFQV
jgi:hypothetical protein